MIYFDNSATTCVDAEVADRAVEIMCRQFGNPSSLHGVGSSAYMELGIARNQIAKMIAARTGDIYFTSGGTESNNIAVQGAARACRWGKHIVTTAIEHDSILKACAYLESGGWQVTYVAPNPDTHHIAAQDIIDAVRDDTVLVSVMFVNNETGEILPIKEIVNGVRKRNPKTLIHCDCVQGFGKLPFKLHVYDVDMISASAHKIHGPKGIGALYLRRPDLVFPLEFSGETHTWNLLADDCEQADGSHGRILTLLSTLLQEETEISAPAKVLLEKIDPAGVEGLTPNSFSHQIRKSVDALRRGGITVSFRKSNGERLICLRRADGVDDPAAVKSVPIDPEEAATAPLAGFSA